MENVRLPKRWLDVNWKLPVHQIASTQGCSTQRVYQIKKQFGIPHLPRPVDIITRMNTARLTAEQVAQNSGCSTNYALSVLRKNGQPYIRIERIGERERKRRTLFTAWLLKAKGYSSKVSNDVDTRLRRVEEILGVKIESVLKQSQGEKKALQRVRESRSRFFLEGSKGSGFPAYRMAVRRYAEFLRSHC